LFSSRFDLQWTSLIVCIFTFRLSHHVDFDYIDCHSCCCCLSTLYLSTAKDRLKLDSCFNRRLISHQNDIGASLSRLHYTSQLLIFISHLLFTPRIYTSLTHSGRFRPTSPPGPMRSALCRHSATPRRGPCCTSSSHTTTSESQSTIAVYYLHC
jgi:hypothetical protein